MRILRVFLIFLGFVFSQIVFSLPAVARVMTDVTQTKITLVDVPQRIVTLAPSLGELAADLLGNDIDRIVAVSDFTDYPPGLKRFPSVGSFTHFSLEKVVSLKPDLVLATLDGNSKDQVLHLRELGLAVVVVKAENFRDIAESIQLVAEALNREAAGKKMVFHLKVGLEKIKEKSKSH